MKTLFIGGIKSGKSLNAEKYLLTDQRLKTKDQRPYYLATTEFMDNEIKQRIQVHQERRENRFITIEEPLDLISAITPLKAPVLIECTTMWINNMLYHQKSREQIVEHITALLALPNDIVFVHNDVGSAIIPDNALARSYVDISGIIAQTIASECDEVYHCIAGIATKIKGNRSPYGEGNGES